MRIKERPTNAAIRGARNTFLAATADILTIVISGYCPSTPLVATKKEKKMAKNYNRNRNRYSFSQSGNKEMLSECQICWNGEKKKENEDHYKREILFSLFLFSFFKWQGVFIQRTQSLEGPKVMILVHGWGKKKKKKIL